MKIYKDIYWSIISPQTLFRAWNVFKSDKRNRPDVAGFERQLEEHIFKLYRELKDCTYRHGGYYPFWICDPKRRHIYKATVRDRVLHHAVFKILNPIFEPTFISTSFSCRIGKGTHKGMLYLRDTVRKISANYTRPCFVLKCDVQKFFDSVDHDVLLEIINAKVKDAETQNLLKEIIESYSVSSTRERERERESTRRFAPGRNTYREPYFPAFRQCLYE